MEYTVNCQTSLENAFLEYSASVAQERSIPDVRDGLKIGLRQTLYAQYSNKLTHKNPFKKAQKSVAAATSQSYVHGDAACYSAVIRAAKPWSYRYPLEEAQGSYGTQCGPDTESASRYVELRSSELSDYLFDTLKKNSIEVWYNNYDDTELIPSVFPSIGFWNIVNGCSGIAVAMATSVPQFNLREVNNALIKLIRNADEPFDNIYCPPDFAGGGIITNAREVHDALKEGHGKSIRIRAKLTYDKKANCIIATELPYGVFVDTILDQLGKITDAVEDYGISKVIDHTKQFADIRIYLDKGVNPEIMIKKLYHDTSLENFFGINMIMLDNGCSPQIFGWRDACLAYIAHIRKCKQRELKYDCDKLIYRNHILDGLKLAIAHIDEVIELIKHSDSASAAKAKLMSKYNLDDDQAKAILDIKLQRLAHLESVEINTEYNTNAAEINNLNDILAHQNKMDELLIHSLTEVIEKFGDDRRTQITNILDEEAEDDIAKVVFCSTTQTGFKLTTTSGLKTTTHSNFIGFNKNGELNKINFKPYELNKLYRFYTEFKFNPLAVFTSEQLRESNHVILITKNGYIKKCDSTTYINFVRACRSCKLKDGDELVSVIPIIEDVNLLITTKGLTRINTASINVSSKDTFGKQLIKNGNIINVKVE